ncbi:hypothetical protein HWQ46_03140 [Shewanella sp. D64]|uniref:hypothetical protein n=1 Tax=unclassified Shewanella TaxID=196818 RepID=UPI0022BA6B13|nr:MULTISPECIES: hypothetical protein [unclassified Shewanella]MEC4724542.1 hypothetical protein [Shewanella sp. D64]MEC4736681.1 hypothetical protein [Shewanella sp. E94]WBJ94649.1 hypothetical protein HWQ47_22780 [Shewanella sp. MTB7]
MAFNKTKMHYELNTHQTPRQQLQHSDVLHPDSPLHYLLPLCRVQMRQLLKQSTNIPYITRQHRRTEQVDFSQSLFTKSLAQPMVKYLTTYIRLQCADFLPAHNCFLLDYRVTENLADGRIVCIDAEQYFVWKHAYKRSF